ncbi:hypothetical protein lerEdw1_004644 [Lerista edwardsae]|nr:hypothetical protein lerEdw1_004644 [Lerista edwardsae]
MIRCLPHPRPQLQGCCKHSHAIAWRLLEHRRLGSAQNCISLLYNTRENIEQEQSPQFKDAKDLDQLSQNNITHIVSIHESPQPFIPGITYLRITLPDVPEANIRLQHSEGALQGPPEGRVVLTASPPGFSLAGISRSTTIVLAYVTAVTQLSWREALEAVKAVRPVANPNPGFRQQLEDYGGSRSARKIHRRLEHKYGAAPFDDDEELRARLPASKRRGASRAEGARQTPAPKSSGPKQADPFLLRVKQTFSCLPGCLK